jgi:RHS repeat-associated protein
LKGASIIWALCLVLPTLGPLVRAPTSLARAPILAEEPAFTDSPPPLPPLEHPDRMESREDMWSTELLADLAEMQSIQMDPDRGMPQAEPVSDGEGGDEGSTSNHGASGSTSTTGTSGSTSSSGSGGSSSSGSGSSSSGSSGSGDATGGFGFSWEGIGPGGGSNGIEAKVNTRTGSRITSLPIVSWSSGSGIGVDLALLHSSRGFGTSSMPKGWRTSYDMWVYQSRVPISGTQRLKAIVHWPDGTVVPYEQVAPGSAIYHPPRGVYDALRRTSFGWRLTTPEQVRHEFNMHGYLSALEDRNGQRIHVVRAGDIGRIQSVVDPFGRSVRFLYGASGILDSLEDPTGRRWTFVRDTESRLTGVSYPVLEGVLHTRSFEYDSSGCIRREVDLNGRSWHAAYDAQRRLRVATDPLGNRVEYSYSTSDTRWSLPAGGQYRHVYDRGRLASEVDPSGFPQSYGYDARNNQTWTTDRRGQRWRYEYDDRGNVVLDFDPLAPLHTPIATNRYDYTLTNDLVAHTNALGQTTRFRYDSRGNLTSAIDALGRTVATATHDAGGRVQSRTGIHLSPASARAIVYDGLGHPMESTDAIGGRALTRFDTLGRLVSVTRPLLGTVTVDYDAWGRCTGYRNADGTVVSFSYDHEGQLTAATNERGLTSTFAFDAAGRQVAATNPRGDQEVYAYNANGWLTAVRNGRGHSRHYEYTTRGDLRRARLPDGSVEIWSFNGLGEIEVHVDALGHRVAFQYDPVGRLRTVDYPSGLDTVFTYDAAGGVATMQDASGTTRWTRNEVKQLVTLTASTGRTDYTYDSAYRRTSVRENGSTAATTYSYDGAGRLTALRNALGETTTWHYDAAHRPIRKVFHTGASTSTTYDMRSRPSTRDTRRSNGSNIVSESYLYDATGHLLQRTTDGAVTTYAYDEAGQLVRETRNGRDSSFAYDGNGNRLRSILNGQVEEYEYDASDRLTRAGNKSFGYDPAGRLRWVQSPAGRTSLDYDFDDRLTRIQMPDGTLATYGYNGIGARISKTVSGSTRTYRRDGAGPADPVLSDGQARFTPGISERRGTATTYSHDDRLGSTLRMSNGSQIVTEARVYSAWGETLSTSGTHPTPFGFAGAYGYQQDPESGLHLVGHRYYDAGTGRFLTRDPIRDGRNWYVYADNNPLTFVDPDGLQAVLPMLAADAASREGRREQAETAGRRAREAHENPQAYRKRFPGRTGPYRGNPGGAPRYTDCGTFVGDCYRDEPGFPAYGTDLIDDHVRTSPRFEEVSPKGYRREPGDIWVRPAETRQDSKGNRTRVPGHVIIVGDDRNAYDASLGSHGPARRRSNVVPGGMTIWRPR